MTTMLVGRRRMVVGLGSIGVLVTVAFVFLRPAPPREPDAVLTFPSLGQVYTITLDTTRARGLVAGGRGVTLFNTDTNTVISTTPMRMYASDALAMAGVAVVAVPGVSTCAVTFIRTRDGAVLRHLQAPNGCIQATVDEALRQVYLLCLGQRTPTGALAGPGQLVAYDLRTGRRRFGVTVGMEPVAAAIDPRTHHVVVANFASSTVTVVDGQRGRVVRTVPVGKNPVVVAVDEQTGRAFVVDDASRSLSVVSIGGGAILPPHLLPMGAYEHLAPWGRGSCRGRTRTRSMRSTSCRCATATSWRRIVARRPRESASRSTSGGGACSWSIRRPTPSTCWTRPYCDDQQQGYYRTRCCIIIIGDISARRWTGSHNVALSG